MTMTGKIAAAAVAVIVLATAGAASAQTRTRAVPANHPAWQSETYGPYYRDSYYNRDYWNAISSHTSIQLHDPFVGTVFENVVPY
jgi:hypothetical protein